MKLFSKPFQLIASGYKTIELRLYDEKRRKIKVDDVIIFTNLTDGTVLRTRVTKLYVFKSFTELYQELPLNKCGYLSEQLSSAKPEDMYEYYSPEQEKQYGVLGIEITLCND